MRRFEFIFLVQRGCFDKSKRVYYKQNDFKCNTVTVSKQQLVDCCQLTAVGSLMSYLICILYFKAIIVEIYFHLKANKI